MCVISFKVSELMEFDDSTFIVCPEFFVIQLDGSESQWEEMAGEASIPKYSPLVHSNSFS